MAPFFGFNRTQQALLQAIKRRGDATTAELSQDAFLSAAATRRHLQLLVDAGLIMMRRMSEGPGRPTHIFSLTDAGDALFPQDYVGFADALLRAVKELEPAAAEKVLDRAFALRMAPRMAAAEHANPRARAEALAEVATELGYLPRLVDTGGGALALELTHCPIYRLATRHPELCVFERRVVAQTIGTDNVKRSKHRLHGQQACVYRIQIESA